MAWTSDLKGLAAAAASGRVRVVETKPGSHDVFDVVDLRAVEVEVAALIDQELDALVLEDFVTLRGGVVERELILEAGAASADDAHAKRGFGASVLRRGIPALSWLAKEVSVIMRRFS